MEDFDKMAAGFDTTRRIERAKAIAGEIRSHITLGHEKSALEYGCGTGLIGFQLIDDFDSILFVDSSPAMIEQVKQKLLGLYKSADNAICYDFMSSVPPDMKVDYIFSSLVLHHITDTKGILSRFYDMLNDGGRVLIVDIDVDDGSFHSEYPDFDGYNGFEHEGLAELAIAVGFGAVDIRTFYCGSKGGKEYSLFILDAKTCCCTEANLLKSHYTV